MAKPRLNCWMDDSKLEQIKILHQNEEITVYRLGQVVSVCDNETGTETYSYRLTEIQPAPTHGYVHLHFDTLSVGVIIFALVGIIGIAFAMFHPKRQEIHHD